MAKIVAGDRIAYSAKFLKNTGQMIGPGGKRRGTYVGIWDVNPKFARVKWDDFESLSGHYQDMYGQNYVDECREKGQIVLLDNIAKINSPKFALNDI